MTIAEHIGMVHQLWPLLAVENINRSIDFYQSQLGFTVVGRAEAEGRAFWCRLKRGGASIMLQQADDEDGPAKHRGRGVALYFVCDDAEQMHAELSSRGLQLAPVSLAEYGMKQMFVPEPNGYSICFESPTDGITSKWSRANRTVRSCRRGSRLIWRVRSTTMKGAA